MESKILRIVGNPGPLVCEYTIEMDVPSKQEILKFLEQPPFNIYSKGVFKFTTGVLGHVKHSVMTLISRDYQEPFFGVYINLEKNSENLTQVSGIKGQFKLSSQTSIDNETRENNLKVETKTLDCNFFKNHSRRPEYCQDFPIYYESRCNWPEQDAHLLITIEVTKLNCANIVCDDDGTRITSSPGNGLIDAKPYLFSSECSDVTIQISDVKIPAHKLILTARSKYFKTMLQSEMKESQKGLVKIEDVPVNLMKEILRFLYTDTVEDIEKNAVQLLILADRYDIEDLAVMCENFLLENLTIHNAMEMFDLSNIAGGRKLLGKRSKEIIMWNKNSFVTDLGVFTQFSKKYPELIFELLRI